jgi:hypothetical protein
MIRVCPSPIVTSGWKLAGGVEGRRRADDDGRECEEIVCLNDYRNAATVPNRSGLGVVRKSDE